MLVIERPKLIRPPLWLPRKNRERICPRCGKVCQTKGGRIYTVGGTVPVGEDGTCCCGITPDAGCSLCGSPADVCDQVSVTLAGIVNDVNCTTCSSFNTTYILQHDGGGGCKWSVSVSGCSFTEIIFLVESTTLRVSLQTAPSNVLTWRKTVTTPVDCTAFSGEVLTQNADGSSYCSFNGSSTATVSCV